jgi:heavy metal sensor kinase
MKINPRSLRARLIGWCLGLAFALFWPAGIYIYFQVKWCLDTTLQIHLSDRAQRIGHSLLEGVERTGEGYVAEEIEGRYSPEEDLRFVRIYRPDGSILYVSGAPLHREFDPAEIPVPPPGVSTQSSRLLHLSRGFPLMLVNYPYSAGSRHYVIQTGQTAVSNAQVMHGLVLSLFLALPIFTAAAVGGVYLLIGKTLASVEQVAAAARKVTLRNLNLRLPETKSGDELERLTQSFNEMIRRLDEAFQHASRLSMDASHELRTPLTIIQGELEVMVREEQRPEAREKAGSLLEEVRRLNHIVRNLFLISRLDAGEAILEVDRLNLTALVHQTEEQMAVLAEEKEISIHWGTDTEVFIDADASRLKQVVVNLLDNAIKYTPRGGRIELSVKDEAGQAVFAVTNSDSQIADESFPFLFERFYRSHRHRFDPDSGAGLGLSIVRSICSAHGGTVEATNLSTNSCSFTVRIPRLSISSGPGFLRA